MKFRKKPVVIDAKYYETADDTMDLLDWIGPNAYVAPGKGITITTLEGNMLAEVGDWIIKGIKGEVYPCKPDIFEATYERTYED